jgi:hypothetical protein
MHFWRCLCFLLAATTLTIPAAAAEWRPINPADLKLKQPKLDPSADAEGLFREVRIANEQHGAGYPTNTVDEYVRLKILSDRGKEFANVQIPYYGAQHIYNVQGRTVKPDGSVVLLSKDAIFDKVLEKGASKTKIVSFALPAVEPGSIIEYRFTRNEGERTNRYRRLEVQSAYPVQELTFFVKPLSNEYFRYPIMRFLPFGCVPERGQLTRDGFDVIQVHDVPAFHEEPFSPPRYSAQSWILIYYEENSKVGKDQYWTALGKELDNEFKQHLKVNGEAKSLAAEITAGAKSDVEKLDRILKYCRTELKDITRDEVSGESVAISRRTRLQLTRCSTRPVLRSISTTLSWRSRKPPDSMLIARNYPTGLPFCSTRVCNRGISSTRSISLSTSQGSGAFTMWRTRLCLGASFAGRNREFKRSLPTESIRRWSRLPCSRRRRAKRSAWVRSRYRKTERSKATSGRSALATRRVSGGSETGSVTMPNGKRSLKTN